MSANGSGSSARFAVIGTGAAGMGVLDALLEAPGGPPITVFDVDAPLARENHAIDAGAIDVEAFYDEVYATIRADGGLRFPPPKTDFGRPLAYHEPRRAGILASHTRGGLTNFWGATMLPFTAAEMASWPVSREALRPHYRRVAEIAGIAGSEDGLDLYFDEGFVNRPPIEPRPGLARLGEAINRAARGTGCGAAGYRIAAGLNRCSVETRPGAAEGCVYCGECMAGCFRGSIYSARRTIDRQIRDPRVSYRRARVRSIEPESGTVRLAAEAGDTEIGGFAKIFLAAGCLGSSEILMRSLGLARTDDLATNSVYVFPILHTGRPADRSAAYFALCNLILACMPDDETLPFAQVQIYPNPDYLYRFNLPERIWPAFGALLARFRDRLFWGRLFVHSDRSQSFALQLEDDRLRIEDERPVDRRHGAQVLESVRKAINREGFWVPPITPIVQKSCAHYGSTLGYGNPIVDLSPDGAIGRRVHLCDSTVFPQLPAVSPTFSIIANARRTAQEAADG